MSGVKVDHIDYSISKCGQVKPRRGMLFVQRAPRTGQGINRYEGYFFHSVWSVAFNYIFQNRKTVKFCIKNILLYKFIDQWFEHITISTLLSSTMSNCQLLKQQS